MIFYFSLLASLFSLLADASLDRRDVWGSPVESVVLDHNRINGSILDFDAILWSASLGQSTLSSMVDSALIGRVAYLYLVSPVHNHECSGSTRSIDERHAGVLESAVFISVLVGASGDSRSVLRNDVEPNEGRGRDCRENIPGIDMAAGTDWPDSVCSQILGKLS